MNKKIDLHELATVFKKNLKIILGISFVFALIGFSFSNYLNEDEYLSSASLIVGEERNIETGELNPETFEPLFERKVVYDDNVGLSNKNIDFYTNVVKSRGVLEKVIKNNNLEISLDNFKESIFINTKGESSIIELGIKSEKINNTDVITNDLSEVFINTVSKITNVENIKIVNQAEDVKIDDTKNIIRNTIIATVLGFIIGTFFVLLIDFFDNKVSTKKDLNKLGLNLLAEINSDSNNLNEELKMLYTRVKNYKNQKNILLLPLDNETNNISIKLASIISKNNKKVLLLDANLRNPTIHKSLSLTNKFGLLNILEEKTDIESSIQVDKDNKNINILTSGETKQNITDLLFLENMEDILSNLSEDYEYIISNTSPIGNVADGLIMSMASDGVILIINRNKDSIAHVNSTLKQLEKLKVKILGAILT